MANDESTCIVCIMIVSRAVCSDLNVLYIKFSNIHTAIDTFCELVDEDNTSRRSFEIVESFSMRASCSALISSLSDAIRDSKLPESLSLTSSYKHHESQTLRDLHVQT